MLVSSAVKLEWKLKVQFLMYAYALVCHFGKTNLCFPSRTQHIHILPSTDILYLRLTQFSAQKAELSL